MLSRIILAIATSVAILISSYSLANPPLTPPTIQLTAENTILFKGEITKDSAASFMDVVAHKRGTLLPMEILYIVIDSTGGDVDAAMQMRAFLKGVPGLALVCKDCQSAAGYLFATAKCPRYIVKGSHMMMHEIYWHHLTAKDLLAIKDMKAFTKQSDDFNKAIYTLIGMPKLEYEKKIFKTKWDVYGIEIIRLHLANKYVLVSCDNKITAIIPKICD